MKFAVWQAMVAVALLSLWFACIIRGNYLLGNAGVRLFGLAAGFVLLMLADLLLRWPKHGFLPRIVTCLFVVATGALVIFPNQILSDYDEMLRIYERDRFVASIQDELLLNPRYRNISIKYMDRPRGRKGEWLQADGEVANEREKIELLEFLSSVDDWPVDAKGVTIDPAANRE